MDMTQEPTPPYTHDPLEMREPRPFSLALALRECFGLAKDNARPLLVRGAIVMSACVAFMLTYLAWPRLDFSSPILIPLAVLLLACFMFTALYTLDGARVGMGLAPFGVNYLQRLRSRTMWRLLGYAILLRILLAVVEVPFTFIMVAAQGNAVVFTSAWTVFAVISYIVTLLTFVLAATVAVGEKRPLRTARKVTFTNLVRLVPLTLLTALPAIIGWIALATLFIELGGFGSLTLLTVGLAIVVGLLLVPLILPVIVMPGVVYRHSVGVPGDVLHDETPHGEAAPTPQSTPSANPDADSGPHYPDALKAQDYPDRRNGSDGPAPSVSQSTVNTAGNTPDEDSGLDYPEALKAQDYPDRTKE